MKRIILLLWIALLACPASALAAEPVSAARQTLSCNGAVPWQRSASLVGRVATVIGPVASTKYAMSSSGSPTFLDIGHAYPNQALQVVIWIEDRAAFGRPETKYRGRTICVHGLVSSYHGVPEIEASSPSQIAIRR